MRHVQRNAWHQGDAQSVRAIFLGFARPCPAVAPAAAAWLKTDQLAGPELGMGVGHMELQNTGCLRSSFVFL